ncbi:MAG: membrane protein insertase YidC [Propionibacteriaceae bacterium]|jgi:YidC/Oxa1 family membrane protein insertase|nr:membrane protein insertase YidC [Propionibacteriaceae bacterium]
MFSMLIPMDFWGDIGNAFNSAMTPLYWAVSGILVGFHSLLTFFGMNPAWGGTWALSIVLLTVVIRTLLIPLFVRQINSSRNMQLLAPKQKALQEKWGHDRERLGQETMKLYKEEGVNPMASCLPLLLQMPIFLSLFYVLNSVSRTPDQPLGYFFQSNPELAQSLHNATIFGAQLSATFLPMQSGFGPTQWVTATLVVLMTIVLFITQLQLMRKNMPPEALTGPMAQQQKMMLYLFPFMYLFMGVNIPIGVLVYWLTTNLWTMGQQYILIHNNPAPGTPAYVDWEERMRAKGKDPDEIAARRRGAKKKPAAGPSDPTRVARQGASSGADAASGASPEEAPKVQRQVISRQQPRKDTRAQRKK